jgi:hypothetical protein
MLAECLLHLHFDGMYERKSQVSDAVEGTNEWLWTHHSYLSWVKERGVLWISGKPGSGKSVLAKSIVRRLSQEIVHTSRSAGLSHPGFGEIPSMIVCDWFYSARHGTTGMSYLSMLRAILHGILSQRLDLFPRFINRYRSERRTYPQPWNWSRSSLRSFLDLLATDNIPILCIVDALDESGGELDPEQSREATLSLMSNLVQHSSIRFIILSRDTPDISKKLKNCRGICLEQENGSDLEKIINANLESIKLAAKRQLLDSEEEDTGSIRPRFTPGRRVWRKRQRKAHTTSNIWSEHELRAFEEIRSYLLASANGVVLWVVLVTKELHHIVQSEKGFTVSQLEESTKRLPVDLRSYYRYILDNIVQSKSAENLKLSQRILAWTIGASSKGPVRVQELWEAMAIPEDVESAQKCTNDPIAQNHLVIGENWNRFKRILYEHSGPFVEVICPPETMDFYFDQESGSATRDIEPTWLVQLLHQTTKEFLSDASVAGPLYVNVGNAEREVEKLAMKYLQICLPVVQTRYFSRGGKLDILYLQTHPLLYFILKNLPSFGEDAYPYKFLLSENATQEDTGFTKTKNVSEFLNEDQLLMASRAGYPIAVAIILAAITLRPTKTSWKGFFGRQFLKIAVEEDCPKLIRSFLWNWPGLSQNRFLGSRLTSHNEIIYLLDIAARMGNKNVIHALFAKCFDEDEMSSIEIENEWLAEAAASAAKVTGKPIGYEISIVMSDWRFLHEILTPITALKTLNYV